MINIPTGPRTILRKAVCAALVFMLGGSLFAAGAIGSGGCGMKCCCRTGSSHMQSAAEQQMQSSMGCCSGIPLSPCDLQSDRPFELPEIALTVCCDNLSKAGGTTAALSDDNGRRQSGGADFISQVLDPKFNSPPLYLQNLAFLI